MVPTVRVASSSSTADIMCVFCDRLECVGCVFVLTASVGSCSFPQGVSVAFKVVSADQVVAVVEEINSFQVNGCITRI